MDNHITLAQLQSLIKRHLEEAVPLPVWVVAEVGEIQTNRSGHCYMELVEKGDAGGVPRARASAVAWRSVWGALHYHFLAATGRELAAGMQVLLRVSVSYHELYGLSLVVSDIDALYTLGDMQRQRQATIAKLQQEGVWEMNRRLPMPQVLQRVAVVSSASAAGYQDFMNELHSVAYDVEVVLFDAVMQGAGAEESIVAALERVASDVLDGAVPAFDAVVIIRGGGAQSDLAAFDSCRLAAHVAQMPIPVIAGIGHDKDQSIVDMVSALSVKTPTAAAGVIIEGFAMLDARIETLHLTLRERVSGVVAVESRRLDALSSLLSERTAAALRCEGERLDALARLVDARRPAAILALGFAIVRHSGAAVRSASTLRAGDLLSVELAEGTVTASVE